MAEPTTYTDPLSEQQHTEARHTYETILKTTLAGFWICDTSGRILDVNESLCQMLGYSRQELLSMTIPEVEADETPEDVDRRIRVIVEQGYDRFESRLRRKDGTPLHIDASVSHLADSGGMFFAFIRDITERKRTEAALRESERRFRIALQNSSIVVYNQDRDLRYTWIYNPLLGFEPEGIIGRTDVDLLLPEDAVPLERIKRRVLETGAGTRETVRTTIQGQPHYYDLSVEPLRDAAGQVVGITGASRDVTEETRAARALSRFADDQALLYAVASLVATLPEPEESLPGILDLVLPRLQADAGWVLLPGDTVENRPRVVAWRGVSDDFIEAEMAVPLKNCPVCAPLIAGEGLQTVPRLMAMCPRLPLEVLERADLHSHIGIPLSAGGQVLGILEVAWREPPADFQENHDLLLAVGQQIGVALENARLRLRVREAAVMEERARLARDLHDSVTQQLYSLTLLAEGWRRLARSGRLDSEDDPLTELGDIAQQALKEMRLMVHELRPPDLEEEGLLGALHQRLGAVEKRAGVEARLVAEDLVELPPDVEQGLYRIALEALNNSLKHASATSVTVRIRARDGWAELEVEDRGLGFDIKTIESLRGLGLASMVERAEKLGGALIIDSDMGHGTRVLARVPCRQRAGAPAG